MVDNLIELSADMATGSSLLSEVDAVDAAVSANRRNQLKTKFAANESDLAPATCTSGFIRDCQETPKMANVKIRSGRSPEVDEVASVENPETETSDGDRSSKERRRHRRKRTYGRLKRIRVEALALAVADGAMESESRNRLIAVDEPQVGFFRSPASSSKTADERSRSSLRRKFPNRNRKSAPTRDVKTSKSETTTTTTMTTKRERRCERYLKQFVAALFSTVGLLCLMVAYTVLGGYVFCQLESSNEVTIKANMRQVGL